MNYRIIKLGSITIPLILTAVIAVIPLFVESEVLIRTVGSSATEGEIWYTNPYDYSSYFIGKTGTSGLGSLAKDDSGTLYSVNHDGELVTINVETGEATIIATITGIDTSGRAYVSIRGLTFGQDGTLYAVHSDPTSSYVEDMLYTIDPNDGSASLIGGLSYVGVQALTTGPDGTIYAYDNGHYEYSARLIIIDPQTGEITDVDPDDNEIGGGWTQSLAFDSNGVLYGVGAGVLSVDIDPDTGETSGVWGSISPWSGGEGSEFAYKLVPSIFLHRYLLGAIGIIWASGIAAYFLFRRKRSDD